MNTILKTVSDNMCISCGICAANCPANCITIERKDSQFLPLIDLEKCVECGLCFNVCPGNRMSEYDGTRRIEDHILGDYKDIYCVKTRDEKYLNHLPAADLLRKWF